MFTPFSATERPKSEYKLLKEVEGVRSRVGCVVRVDSYFRATVDVISCEAGNLAEHAWLANADFNRARVATEIANSIRGVSITTRRQYTVSISSRPQLAHALIAIARNSCSPPPDGSTHA